MRHLAHAALLVAVGSAALATPSASGAAASSSSHEMLCDGGFAAATSPCWNIPPIPQPPAGQDPEPMPAAITQDHPRGGTGWSVHMCNYDSCETSFQQDTIVPETATAATVTFWVASFTTDSSCHDYITVIAASPADGIGDFTRDDVCSDVGGGDGAWVRRTLDVTPLVQAHRGGDVRVWFSPHTDAQLPTDFYLDDVRLDVDVATPRSVSLALSRHLVARGTLAGDAALTDCTRDVRVRVQRRHAGRWVTVGTARTDRGGGFREELPDRAGTYRATVQASPATSTYSCPAARSASRTHD